MPKLSSRFFCLIDAMKRFANSETHLHESETHFHEFLMSIFIFSSS